jgi:macrocin-O-methyltransferase TylF-like protien
MNNPDSYQHHRVPHTPAYQFGGHQLVSDQVSSQDIAVVWRELKKVLQRGIPGAIVEFGCYVGTTSLFIRRLLDTCNDEVLPPEPQESPLSGARGLTAETLGSDDSSRRVNAPEGQEGVPILIEETPANLMSREFHVYNSFEGLPAKAAQDASAAGADFGAGKLAVSKKEFLQQFRAANLTPPIIHRGWFDDLGPDDVPPQIAFAFLDGDFYASIRTSLQLVWPRLSQGGVVLIDDFRRPELPGVEHAVQDFFGGQPPDCHVEHNIAILRR